VARIGGNNGEEYSTTKTESTAGSSRQSRTHNFRVFIDGYNAACEVRRREADVRIDDARSHESDE